MLPVTLPAEVWLNIVTDHRILHKVRYDFGRRHKFLASLSLVSPDLRDLIQPLLFESLELTWYAHLPGTEKVENTRWRIEYLSHWLETRPEVAGWVRRLSLTGSRNSRDNSDPFQSEDFMALFKSLKNLRDLHTLELFFHTGLYAQLFCFPRLRSCHVMYWGGDEDEGNSTIDLCNYATDFPMEDLALEKLYIRGPLGPYPAGRLFAALALAPKLRALNLSAPSPSASLSSLYSLSQSVSHSIFQRLCSLELNARFNLDVDALYTLLASCQNITRLELIHWERCEDDPAVFLADADKPEARALVPRLECYKGPFPIAKALIVGRPVRDIDVRYSLRDSQHDLMAQLEPLLLGTVPVRRLRVDHPNMHEGRYPMISDLVPDLEGLELGRRTYKPEFLDNVVEDLGSFMNLRTLLIIEADGLASPRLGGEVAEAVESFLAKASIINPSLAAFEFRHPSYCWHRSDEGTWMEFDKEEDDV